MIKTRWYKTRLPGDATVKGFNLYSDLKRHEPLFSYCATAHRNKKNHADSQLIGWNWSLLDQSSVKIRSFLTLPVVLVNLRSNIFT